jgi:hypothetical protein
MPLTRSQATPFVAKVRAAGVTRLKANRHHSRVISWYVMIVSPSLSARIVVTAAFVSSRIFYYLLGIRFDSSYLYQGWQYLDVNLLRDHLAESILHLHSQPPLFNLLLGLTLKWFPGHPEMVFHFIYCSMTLAMALALPALLHGLGLPLSISVGVTVLYVISPTTVLFENVLLYAAPIAALLVLAAYALMRWIEKPRLSRGLAFFFIVAVIVLTRSLFQVLWPLAVCVLLVVRGGIPWKSVVLAAIVPLVILLAWQTRNYQRFGEFVTSSWLGLNLSRNTVERLSPDELASLMSQGRLSPLAVLPAFSSFDEYRGMVPEPQLTRIPALDQEFKRPPSYGFNYNYIGYIFVSRERLRDALYVIVSMPGRFARNVVDAAMIYFTPAGQYLADSPNGTRLRCLKYLSGEMTPDGPRLLWRGWIILVWHALAFGYGAYVTVLCRGSDVRDRCACTVIAFMWLTLCYVTVVANLTEIWENNRIRFLVDPFAWVIAAVAVQHAYTRWKRKHPTYRGACRKIPYVP